MLTHSITRSFSPLPPFPSSPLTSSSNYLISSHITLWWVIIYFKRESLCKTFKGLYLWKRWSCDFRWPHFYLCSLGWQFQLAEHLWRFAPHNRKCWSHIKGCGWKSEQMNWGVGLGSESPAFPQKSLWLFCRRCCCCLIFKVFYKCN